MFIRYSAQTEQRLAAWTKAQILRPLDVALLRALPGSATLPEPLLMLLMLASAQVAQGHVCLDLTVAHPRLLLPALLRQGEAAQLLSQYFSQFPLRQLSHDLAQMAAGTDESAALVAVIAQPNTASLSVTTAKPFVLWQQRLYLWRYAVAESTISQFIRQRASGSIVGETAAVAAVLQRLFPANGRVEAEPDWQLQACALAYLQPFAVITGGPGTGKTTTVIKLLLLLLSQQTNLQIVLAAPTGKAAARLTESISQSAARLAAEWPTAVAWIQSQKAQTVHRLLQPKPDGSGFRYGVGRPIPADVVIVDEASMLDINLFAALLQALPAQCRLILLGDKDQLASVEAGAVLAELCAHAQEGRYSTETLTQLARLTGQSLPACYGAATADWLDQQVIMLRTSHRFAADSGIGALARAVNSGDERSSLSLLQSGSADIKLLDLATPAQLADFVIMQLDSYLRLAAEGNAQPPAQFASQLHQQLSSFQLLTALRQGPDGSETLNQLIEQRIRRVFGFDSQELWYPGRAVIILQNDYGTGLMNGDIGIALSAGDAVRVAFVQTDGTIRFLLPGRLPQHEAAYALTVHKSQGSEYQHAALYLPAQWSPVLNRELLYTAITRARQQFSLICPQPLVLQQAVLLKTERNGALRLQQMV